MFSYSFDVAFNFPLTILTTIASSRHDHMNLIIFTHPPKRHYCKESNVVVFFGAIENKVGLKNRLGMGAIYQERQKS